jgi:1-acyl-sn-glycerol-3-phosphate acyltransferase
MTAEWRHWGIFAPISRWVLRRIATLYDAFLMPPTPPSSQDAIACAATVRQVINWARSHPAARVCLAPEGHDSSDGHLIMPPPGVGRFMLHLGRAGMIILPAGVWEDGKAWQVRFGPTFTLEASGERLPDARDAWARRRVMRAIAEQLPEHLRGEFGNRFGVS